MIWNKDFVKSLQKLIEKYNVISFDVFDTALKRDVYHPCDVFHIVEQETNVSGFYEKRILAEKNAREHVKNGEATFDEIYSCIDYSQSEIEILKEYEIKTEEDVLLRNSCIFEIYSECIRLGKKVFFISDMYHSEQTISAWLVKCGFDIFDGLFVSCTYRVNKKSGELYKCFLNREGIKTSDVLHIGNSKKSDILGAWKAGIKAFYIPTHLSNSLYFVKATERWQDKYLYSFINNRVSTIESRPMKLGYELLGPIVFGYCKWLHERAGKQDRIAFLARDMWLFYETYIMMYPDEEHRCSYVRISRQAILPAVLCACEDYHRINLLWSAKVYSVRQVLERMNLSADKYEGELNRVDITNINKPDKSLSDSDHPLWVWLKKKRNDVVQANKEKSELAVMFLKKEFGAHSIALCDLGWHGTTQSYLEMIFESFGIDTTLAGFYIGSFGPNDRRKIREKCYLFNPSHLNPYFGTGTFLLETMCLEMCGSVVEYRQYSGIIEPVLEECDQRNKEYVDDIQTGCRRFISDAIADIRMWNMTFSKKQIFSGYLHLLNMPDKQELSDFKHVSYYDRGLFYIIENKSRMHYLTNPSECFQDFLRSRWKGGFIAELTGFNAGWQGRYYRMVWKKK